MIGSVVYVGVLWLSLCDPGQPYRCNSVALALYTSQAVYASCPRHVEELNLRAPGPTYSCLPATVSPPYSMVVEDPYVY